MKLKGQIRSFEWGPVIIQIFYGAYEFHDRGSCFNCFLGGFTFHFLEIKQVEDFVLWSVNNFANLVNFDKFRILNALLITNKEAVHDLYGPVNSDSRIIDLLLCQVLPSQSFDHRLNSSRSVLQQGLEIKRLFIIYYTILLVFNFQMLFGFGNNTDSRQLKGVQSPIL